MQRKSWVFPALVIGLGLAGPSHAMAQQITPSTVVGRWVIQKGQKAIFTFRPDSTVTYEVPELTIIATTRWRLVGDTVVLKQPMDAKLKGTNEEVSGMSIDPPIIISYDAQKRLLLTTRHAGIYDKVDSTASKKS